MTSPLAGRAHQLHFCPEMFRPVSLLTQLPCVHCCCARMTGMHTDMHCREQAAHLLGSSHSTKLGTPSSPSSSSAHPSVRSLYTRTSGTTCQKKSASVSWPASSSLPVNAATRYGIASPAVLGASWPECTALAGRGRASNRRITSTCCRHTELVLRTVAGHAEVLHMLLQPGAARKVQLPCHVVPSLRKLQEALHFDDDFSSARLRRPQLADLHCKRNRRQGLRDTLCARRARCNAPVTMVLLIAALSSAGALTVATAAASCPGDCPGDWVMLRLLPFVECRRASFQRFSACCRCDRFLLASAS